MNKLSFEIETDAPYSDEEIADLRESFIQFMEDIDQDVDSRTAKVVIADAEDIETEKKKIREAALALLDNSELKVSVSLSVDGEGFDFPQLSSEDL
jgi:superfamily II DNA or RNA helicase